MQSVKKMCRELTDSQKIALQSKIYEQSELTWYADKWVKDFFPFLKLQDIVEINVSTKNLLALGYGCIEYWPAIKLLEYLNWITVRNEIVETTLIVFTDASPEILSGYHKVLFQNFRNLNLLFSNGDISHFSFDEVLLSIIVPIYNVGNQIPTLTSSFEALQDYPIEVLFIDDGSTDDSSQQIENWIHGRDYARIIYKTNGGCATARNLGLASAIGTYLQFVDGDDAIDASGVLSSLVEIACKQPDIAIAKYATFTDVLTEAQHIDTFNWLPEKPAWISNKFLVNNQPTIWRCFYRRDFLIANQINFLEVRRYDDLPFWYKTGMRSSNTLVLDDTIYFWRLEREGQSMEVRDERLYVHFEIFKNLTEWATSNSCLLYTSPSPRD